MDRKSMKHYCEIIYIYIIVYSVLYTFSGLDIVFKCLKSIAQKCYVSIVTVKLTKRLHN